MKKNIIGLSLAAAIFASGAFAADNTPELITSGDQVILSDCSLLADDVTLTLSTGVLGGYRCVVGAAGTTNNVRVATCHQNGRTASRTVETPCGTEAGQDACTTPGTNVNTSTNSGASIFIGRTSGGAIGPDTLDGSVCNTAGITGKLGQ